MEGSATSATVVVAILLAGVIAGKGAAVADFWRGTYWGEPESALLAHFGPRATVLPRPLDFGDSYARLALPNVRIGGVALTVFLQIDKATHGLRRIQFVRNRHAVNPAAFHAVLSALEAEYGSADAYCANVPMAATGYQAAAERLWHRDGGDIRLIFRDTTVIAFEGCLADPSFGPCGLVGQLLLRISAPGSDEPGCRIAASPR